MTSNEIINQIESEGFDLLKQKQWTEARNKFEKMLSHSLTPIREVKLLYNIMKTYEREGKRDEAISICKKAIIILETNKLWYNNDEGATLFGTFKGHYNQLSNKSFISNIYSLNPDFYALFTGMFYGTLLSKLFLGGSWIYLIGGAIVGFFILSRLLSKITKEAVIVVIGLRDVEMSWLDERNRKVNKIVIITLTVLLAFSIFLLFCSKPVDLS